MYKESGVSDALVFYWSAAAAAADAVNNALDLITLTVAKCPPFHYQAPIPRGL